MHIKAIRISTTNTFDLSIELIARIGPEAGKRFCIFEIFANMSALNLKRESTSSTGIDN